ncbi:MAG: hypothetical protein CMP39_04340 [Rickettsiales bacterium]|nr:hypothetical protein [Rickettsiales bacterium]|tara:strand:+ start:2403 stop:2777 length:375 start_codon:yes stop_codon:yes gene_type:complete
MKYSKHYCCKTDDNIWERDDLEPPCEVCPNNVILTERNHLAVSAFKDLDQTGRDIGFDIGFIREEAIDVYLNRFDCNTPQVYDALVFIDREVTQSRRDKNELDRKNKQKNPPSKAKPRMRNGSR